MIEKFKQLSKQKKLLVGIISVLLFPITVMLIAAEVAINGFKEGKLIKLIIGVMILLLFTSIFWSNNSSECENLYDEQKIKLDDTLSELDRVKIELEDKNKILDKEKVYLELSDDEKSKVYEYIDEMKNPQNTEEEDTYNSENDNKRVVNKSIDTSNNESSSNGISNYSNNDSSSYNSSTDSQSSGGFVYANGGSSTSNKYHSSANAHNMEGGIQMTVEEARSKGYVPCKRCY